MSLRTRLSLLYALLGGIVLTIFGVMVYTLVSVMLVDQIDRSLAANAYEFIAETRLNADGEVETSRVPVLDATSTIYMQLWGPGNSLVDSSINITNLTEALDPVALHYAAPVFRDTRLSGRPLRVLTVPMVLDGRKMVTLQVGTNRELVDQLQGILLAVLAFALVIAILMAGFYGWLATGMVLVPLEKVTNAARRIAGKESLSIRLPVVNSRNEIGILAEAFNQVLDRLEYTFTRQKQFLADVSHELRSPLTVIKGNVGLIRKLKEADAESLDSIDTEADRLTRMVGDLLLIAQAEAGKLEMQLAPVELDSLLLEVVQQGRVLSGDKAQLKVKEIDEVLVNGDRDRLKQVLINLIANAVKYSPAGSSVYLSLKKENDQAIILVEDNGPGIPSKDIPHIFERFYRSDKARTRSGEGSSFGLGLSIVYWIIRNHSGTIEVESQEGHGSTFKVSLPLEVTEGTKTHQAKHQVSNRKP